MFIWSIGPFFVVGRVGSPLSLHSFGVHTNFLTRQALFTSERTRLWELVDE